MHSASAVQALFDVFVQSVALETRSCATRRPGWVQATIPDAGPLGGIEDRRAEVPGVGSQNVDLDGGFHEGL